MSDNSSADQSPVDNGERIIYLDILPLIQIIKHAQGVAPTNVSGQLLGYDNDQFVEVTYAYGMPIPGGDTKKEDLKKFQGDMINSLHETNIDSDIVGWYTSTFMSSFCTPELITSQYVYQKELGHNTVALVIDSFELSRGKLDLRAYRLTKEFVDLFSQKKITMDDIRNNKFTSSMILNEVPINLSVNPLASVLLHQCGISSIVSTETTVSANPTTSLEKNMEQLLVSMDNVISERRTSYYENNSKSHKQKQTWSNAGDESRLRQDMGDDMVAEVEMEDKMVMMMDQNDHVEPMLKYCVMKDFCGRLRSVTTDDGKVLEKKL